MDFVNYVVDSKGERVKIICEAWSAYKFSGDHWCITDNTTSKYLPGYEDVTEDQVIDYLYDERYS